MSKTSEAMKILASTNGISTIAILKLGCGLDLNELARSCEITRYFRSCRRVDCGIYV